MNSLLDVNVLNANKLTKARHYWKQRMEGFEINAYMGSNYNYSKSTKSISFKKHEVEVPETVQQMLLKAADSVHAKYIILLSVLGIMVQKSSMISDILIFTPAITNPNEDDETSIIPLRLNHGTDLTFKAYVHKVKELLLTDLRHKDFPSDRILGISKKELREIPSLGIITSGIHKPDAFESHPLDIHFSFELEDTLRLKIKFKTNKFDRDTVQRLGKLYCDLFINLFKGKDSHLDEVGIISDLEKEQITTQFNRPIAPVEADATVLSVFRQQVQLTPENIAISFGKYVLTYQEVDDFSGQVSSFLKTEYQVKNGDLVGVMLERDLYLIPVLYGILKAGAAYVPIDPKNPKDRKHMIIEDSKLQAIISRDSFNDLDSTASISFIDLDTDFQKIEEAPIDNDITVGGKDLAYVIYTSGSTGKPKGVMIEHQSLLSTVTCMQENYPLNESDVFLLKTSFTFDVSCSEIFGWFFAGGSITVLTPGDQGNPSKILELIESDQVTHINFVPSMFSLFVEELQTNEPARIASLRHIFLAGEALSKELVGKFQELNASITLKNVYGPTEATIYSSGYAISPSKFQQRIPIGKALDNVNLHILDKDGNHQPIGIPGELCISGNNLAKGYLHNEQLTAERFVPNPVLPDRLMYRSGDLCRWLPDGNIEFLDRIDDQVKIRGFRIELGEIAFQLQCYDQVRDAVVIVVGTEGDKQLVAYYSSEHSISNKELVIHLEERLPDYMIPSYYIHLPKIPLNSSGKVNAKGLPEIQIHSSQTYQGPGNETEEKLVEIWSEVLKLDANLISVNKSFFEMGGHSLRAMVMVNKIREKFEVEVPLKMVFDNKDIISLSAVVKEASKSTYEPIKKAELKEYYQLSPTQKSMYFLHEFDRSALIFNQPRVLRLKGQLDIERMEAAFRTIISRHDVFRTSFKIIQGDPVQVTSNKVHFEIERHFGTEDQVRPIMESAIRPFDLTQAPLLRVCVVQVNPEEHYLLVDTHHLIMDGTADGFLTKEAATLYAGEQLSAPNLQYRDYLGWLQSNRRQKELKLQEEFWDNEFKDGIPSLHLPNDFPRPTVRNNAGKSVTFEIDTETVNRLRSMTYEENTTIFIILLSTFNVLLSKLSGQEDIVIGTPAAGRGHVDFQDTMGMFLITIPLRNYPKSNLTFKEFSRQVKSKTLNCFDNQDHEYEVTGSQSNVKKDTSHNALFDVMFVAQNFEQESLEVSGLSFEPYSKEVDKSKFDLTLTSFESGERIILNFEYSTKLFKDETVKGFTNYFQKILSTVISEPDIKLSEISILSEEEQIQILTEFNQPPQTNPENLSLTGLFEEQVMLYGDSNALLCKDQQVTYKVLNERVNQLSRYLMVTQKVENHDSIGVCFDRSPEMIVACLAILKVGASYVPIEPDFPEERIATMIEQSKIKCVLTNRGDILDKVHSCNAINLLEEEAQIRTYESTNLGIEVAPDTLAYTTYTSGSTGLPKGIQIEQSSVLDYAITFKDHFNILQSDRVIQQSSLMFDTSIEEIFPTLLSGALLIIMPDGALDIDFMVNSINALEASVLSTTPGVLSLLNEHHRELESLRLIISGGDTLLPSQINHFIEGDCEVYNTYGPTESTVCITYNKLHKLADTKVIGKPIRNRQVYILNKHGGLCPVLVAGEICVSGSGLARGYINNSWLSEEKFVENPFVEGERMYKTGDLGRWMPDGSIEFLGRLDNQVKVNGYRIELEEVTKQLSVHDDVKDAIVVTKEYDGIKYLAGYYVADEHIKTSDLKFHLSSKLPEYMIPTFYVRLEKLPLTVRGKIDLEKLPNPSVDAGESYKAPDNELEKELVEIWAEVLKLDAEGLSVSSSFFELGGHSLKAMFLIHKISKVLKVDVPIREIFVHQNIRQLATYISQVETETPVEVQVDQVAV